MPMNPSSEQAPGKEERETTDREPVVLEKDVSLSQSLIWRLQREYYAQRGLRAWTEDMVPQYITNNPFIAEIYARTVFCFLCDCIELGRRESRPLSRENPLRMVELGAGPGKFSFLFLRHLSALLREHNIPLETVRYRMTDCSESVIQAWRANSYLAEFAGRGMLEFELLPAGAEVRSWIADGKDIAAPNLGSGAVVVIANYVFDSLPQDAFVIQEGQIFEALVTTAAGKGEGGDLAADTLSQLQFSYRNVELSPNRYAKQSWNAILEGYRSALPAATVLFPSGALKTLQDLCTCTDGRILVLAADKGCVHEDHLALFQGPPALEFHAANCFSQMVNFHAIGKYFEAIGGEALVPEKHSLGLNICAFLRGRSGDQFPATNKAYQEAQEAFGPDDLFALLGWLNAHMEEISVPQILAVLRLSRWDPVALMRLFPVLGRQLRAVVAERHDLRNAAMRTWANHYPVHASENVIAFQCGVILLELRFFEDAVSMFKISQRIFGSSAATSYNLGLCCLGLGKSSEALAYMVEACDLDSNFEPAQTTRLKLEKESARE